METENLKKAKEHLEKALNSESLIIKKEAEKLLEELDKK